jgi:hypothetical protein
MLMKHLFKRMKKKVLSEKEKNFSFMALLFSSSRSSRPRCVNPVFESRVVLIAW